MAFRFKATIQKIGINPCVEVPVRITDKMKVSKGFIYIKGKINGHEFVQTLMPAKNKPYRLYVNGPMLKGAHLVNGDTATFTIEHNPHHEERTPKILPVFNKRLRQEKLGKRFQSLTPSRRKEILRYMSFLKTQESVGRNIEKVIRQLKEDSRKMERE